MVERRYWLNARHNLVRAALLSYVEQPLLTGLSVCAAILAKVEPRPDLGDLTKLAERLAKEGASA